MSKTDLQRVKRVDTLTEAQRTRMPEWRDRWIAIGLSTERADRERFERAIPIAYEAAELAPPKRIVWTTSPLALAFAAPTASLILAARERGGIVGGAVDGAVGDAVGGAVGDAVGDAVGGAVRDAVGGAVRDAVDGAVRDAVGGAVRNAVGDAVDDAVDGAVRDAVGGAVRNAVRNAVGGAVRDAVGDADQTRRAVLDAISQAWYYILGGQFWVGGWWGGPAFVSFFRDVCGLDLSEDIERRAAAHEDMCSSACWVWPHREFAMVCERPSAINRDENGRLHCLTGPAIVWPDGWGIYCVHGVRVPGDVIEDRSTITVDRIAREQNAEVRRVMIDLYGIGRYVTDAQFQLLDDAKDPLGLPRRLYRGQGGMLVIEMTNSTPDADGSRRVYFGVLHPQLRPLLPNGGLGEPQELTALNGVASSYGLRGEEYVLAAET